MLIYATSMLTYYDTDVVALVHPRLPPREDSLGKLPRRLKLPRPAVYLEALPRGPQPVVSSETLRQPPSPSKRADFSVLHKPRPKHPRQEDFSVGRPRRRNRLRAVDCLGTNKISNNSNSSNSSSSNRPRQAGFSGTNKLRSSKPGAVCLGVALKQRGRAYLGPRLPLPNNLSKQRRFLEARSSSSSGPEVVCSGLAQPILRRRAVPYSVNLSRHKWGAFCKFSAPLCFSFFIFVPSSFRSGSCACEACTLGESTNELGQAYEHKSPWNSTFS